MTIQELYKPKNINDIIGNKKSIVYIRDWLENYEKVQHFLSENGLLKKSSKGRKKKLNNINQQELEFSKRKGNLLITGIHGSGKSTIINIILDEYNYDIINLNNLDPKVKITNELMVKLKNNTLKNIVLLIDDLESIITLNDKNGLFNIIKENNYKRWFPIIIVTNNQHNKQLNEIKKYSNEVKIFTPFKNEIYAWIYYIIKKENINLDNSLINKFIDYCQNDLRKILIQLNELKINYYNNKIDEKILDQFMNIMKQKDLDFDLYKATSKLLSNYTNIESCLELYETEKVLLPLMIHENYYKFINNNHYYDIINNLSTADLLENYIYGEQNWDLLELHGIISCAIPSYLINKFKNDKTNQSLVFAADLNRTSVKKMNKKNISKTNNSLSNNSQSNIRNKSIDEFIYMGEIINKLNKNGKINIDNIGDYNNIVKINKLKNINSKI